jgi:hypothetical protein
MRETQEVKRLRFPLAALGTVSGSISPELDQPRLLGMEFQPELRETLRELDQEPLRLGPMLESHDEVVRPAHDDDLPARLRLPPPSDPPVEYVVEVEVSQERADATALDRPFLSAISG